MASKVSLGIRLANFILDFLFFIIITTGIFILIGKFIDTSLIQNGYSNRLLSILIYLSYYTITESVLGTTPGKRITKTKVVQNNGEKLTFPTAVIRSFCRIIPFEPISILFSANNLMWHDKISNTQVIRIEP
jgi:uncharacterized RDD family membrane protein YckC